MVNHKNFAKDLVVGYLRGTPMQESASILFPTGYIMDVGLVAPVNGTGTMGQHFVAPVLPGGAFHTRGTGVFDLTNQSISGRSGALRVTLTTGASGSAQAVVFIVLSSTAMLGIALDSSNRPYAILKDRYGTTVGQSKVIGSALGAGIPLTLNLSWNSQGVVFGGRFASMVIGNEVADWTTSPVSAWDWLTPQSLYVGTSLGGLGLSDFTGTIGIVQLGTQPVAPPAGSDVAESIVEFAIIAGSASMGATAKVAYAASDTMAGSASFSANATVTGP
jgi:hypothetical protein